MSSSIKFTYNPEWFEDEDEGDEEDWDLSKYRRYENDDDDEREVEEGVQSLDVRDDGESSGGSGD